MWDFEFFAQAIGIVAMAFNVLSFQCKNQKGIVALQLFGTALFCVNFFMLGAIAGGISNFIGALRNVVFLTNENFVLTVFFG